MISAKKNIPDQRLITIVDFDENIGSGVLNQSVINLIMLGPEVNKPAEAPKKS